MKKMHGFLLFLALVLNGFSTGVHAADTDIYVDNANTTGVPNVMFVLFNGADMDADSGSTCTYADGTAPSAGSGKVIGLLQCALVNAISNLTSGSVNIGIAVVNPGGLDVQATQDKTAGGFHDVCSSSGGGCIVRKLMTMDAAGKVSMTAFIKGLAAFTGGKTDANGVALKVNTSSADPATAMQEVWAYYNGKTGGSGTDYSANSILATGCQRNFVVYIGTSAKGVPTNAGDAGITAAQVGATAAQLVQIAGTVKFNPSICGAPTYTLASGNDWADEWARLMNQQDGGAAGNQNTQSITTYTINVQAKTCTAEFPGLLSSMARNGGGKFFDTTGATNLQDALNSILNEVQAVNSVFSSASLPVSVNAEGSYLNQIYLGMFRPDSTGAPRWLGNLKQYQLIMNTSGNLVLGDSLGKAAISSAGTGFISPNAVSFWSKKDTSKLPDSTGGYYVNDPKGVPPSPFDSPDGEVVEKGGVAQQLRLESLVADFSSTNGSSTNPRRLYTYCPSGSGCNASLTDSSNAFSTANSGISTAAFGTSTAVPISSIVRTGTTALVTTIGSHGFTTGASVTISNAFPSDYNVTQTVTVNSPTTFTLTGLPDYPTTPSAGTYTVSNVLGGAVSVSSITRTSSATGSSNTETATATTATAHGFTTLSNISVSGASPAAFSFAGTPASVTSTTFTFPVAIEPRTPAANTYQVQISPTAYPAITNVSLSNTAQGVIVGSTSSASSLHVGQVVTISGAVNSKYNGSMTITAVTSTTFTIGGASASVKNQGPDTGTVTPNTTLQSVTTITRTGTTVAATATMTVSGANNFFGGGTGSTKTVNITKLSGTQTNESAYVASNVTITCANSTCTQFTYPVAVTPALSASGTITAQLQGSSLSVAAGGISRSGTTATLSCGAACPFSNGQTLNIAASGSALTSESAYVGSWTYTCATTSCSSFTFGPVTLSPSTPATGSNMQAYSGSTPPDKNTIIRWMRGEDNYGDEKGPGGTVTVRPSVHGDVLHSRPLVINYGDASRGIVVYYGSNDGVFHAVNGNQTGAIGTVPAGDELWGLVLPEHYNEVNRLRLNSPELRFPSTVLATARPKDYFVDGPTGAYQKLKADGTIDKAYIFMTMRRGGSFMYALDVSTPTTPTVLWKISRTTTGFEELGQTWSRPRLTLLQGGGSTVSTTPVLVFGAGYDPAEDSEPPATDTMGRGIYIVNAATGALIWSANSSCTTSSTCLNVPGMIYAIPSDIAFVDRDLNGSTDKIYFGDVGGNIWRADVSDASTSNWSVTKLAALGCAAGTCAAGTTPRKFFFPPSVLTVRPAGQTGSYDLVSLASGDREHPLKSTATGSSYNVSDEFFTIRDTGTAVGTPVTSNVTMTNLFNATTAQYDGTLKGFYVNFTTGEKAVNAPLAVNGSIFFATNRPVAQSQTCAANLGEAKAYAVSPFLGTTTTNILPGGGLAPSAVSGLITIQTTNADGTTTSSEQKFCIGCGIGGGGGGSGPATCNSALENCSGSPTIPKNLKRTYWYKK